MPKSEYRENQVCVCVCVYAGPINRIRATMKPPKRFELFRVSSSYSLYSGAPILSLSLPKLSSTPRTRRNSRIRQIHVFVDGLSRLSRRNHPSDLTQTTREDTIYLRVDYKERLFDGLVKHQWTNCTIARSREI